MTRRTTTRRPRTNREQPVPVLAKGFAVLALFLAIAYVATQSINGVPGRAYDTVYVEVADKGSIIKHDAVRIAGVQVGQVLQVASVESGGARLELQLERGTALPVDSQVRIRANGLLGARYIQLVEGRSRTLLADGATIRGRDDALTSGLAEALDTFDAPTRRAFGSIFDELGEGLAGNGRRLNRAIPQSSAAMEPFQGLVAELRRRPGSVERFLPSLSSGMRPLAANRIDIAEGFEPTDRALRPFVDRRPSVRETIDVAPPTLTAADTGLRDGRRLLAAARTLSVSASRTLPDAPGGLRAATRLLEESPRPLRRADALLRQVPGAVGPTLIATARLRPLLPRVDGLLRPLIPMVRLTGTYECDIVNFGTVFRSMTGFGGVGEGPAGAAMQFRLQAVVDPPVKTGKVERDGYPEPCKYLASTYPTSDGAVLP